MKWKPISELTIDEWREGTRLVNDGIMVSNSCEGAILVSAIINSDFRSLSLKSIQSNWDYFFVVEPQPVDPKDEESISE